MTTPINETQYRALYQQSIENPEKFWGEQAHQYLTWFTPWQHVVKGDFNTGDIRWFEGAKLNACYNCVDRHLPLRANQPALIWEGNEPEQSKTLTYQQLHEKICQLAHVLKSRNVQKGDHVCIYMPMIPEAVIAMLACARIGAVHTVVFAGFSAESLKTRLLDAECCVLITADGSHRGDKHIALKEQADQALTECQKVHTVIVVEHTHTPIHWLKNRDISYHQHMSTAPIDSLAEPMEANDPLFILYTSGSTGKPKGIQHGTAGYLLYAAMTHHIVFDYQEREIYWCTADIGWITGHTYLVYGPLANGASTLIFEGTPQYPDPSRYWQIIDKHQVNIFYTAPTAIRALRREGDVWVLKTKRNSLKRLGSVGEPINPDVWQWYYDVVGNSRCPIVDTWWQTETGGIMITPLPGAMPLIPGAAGWPFFGIVPEVVDDHGHPVPQGTHGELVIKNPWPGMLQTIHNNSERFINAYFKPVPGCYYTGDNAFQSEMRQFHILGRNDDVIKVSGHRLSTEELESALVSHPSAAEAGVVGIPDAIKGERICAFVCTQADIQPNDALKHALIEQVRIKIGAIAAPAEIHWAPDLPKTRSGKIMRRILRQIACHETESLGDTSTLANPQVVADLIAAVSRSSSNI